MILADRIRKYAIDQIIEPARRNGLPTATVHARDIHAGLDLDHRFPAVCGALDTDIFLDMARVTLLNRTGPRQSSSVVWVFALNSENGLDVKAGIGK